MEFRHPVLLIKIPETFHPGMSALKLYEATRGVWRVGNRRLGARYALGIFDGFVREVYVIDSWQPAGTDPYSSRVFSSEILEGRSEFVGRVAPDEVRNLYLH